MTTSRNRAGLAAVLSFLIPGLGQFYNGKFLRGLFWLLITPGIWIGRESGAQMGGELFSDALSEPSGPAPTYVSMFKNNVPKLVDGMLMNGS